MQEKQAYLLKASRNNRIQSNLWQTVTCLSLAVILCVFWGLKLTGITLAGEAFCGMAEHVHSEACLHTLTCALDEDAEHQHSEACLIKELVCQTEETGPPGEKAEAEPSEEPETASPEEEPETAVAQEHTHTDGCWRVVAGFGCGLTEAEGHTHTAACVTEETGLECGVHLHTASCYDALESCPLEEHVHVESCYSDITADLETEEIWEQSVAAVDRESTTANQLVQVATSQLGQTESEKNFQVDAHGIRRGITRYGQWYGNPYGDWSAMFVSFCLHYAGVEDVPANAGPESMRLEWETAELYKSRDEELPKVGNLLFLNMEDPEDNLQPRATFVAIITKVENGIVTAIAGDVDGTVAEIDFSVDVPRIVGYGLVPEVSGYAPVVDEPPMYAVGDTRYIWLDGTCGGLMSLGGSDNTRYTATEGGTLTLPTQWKSPEKYDYVLRGWYDIRANKYYEAGATMPVTQNTVLYADWQAATYDIGQFNEMVDTSTLDTNDFITTRVFDYGILFNMLSENVDVTVDGSGHSEVWNLLTSGDNPYNGEETLGFIFRDWDRSGEDISYPKGHDAANNPTNGGVYPGLYTDTIRDLLFDPEVQTLGKTYLGEGNYLFQLCQDRSHNHYGDYYYNSERNAASYNQSDQRFYVYDYLECTRDSTKGEANYSDFLPFNSPYANANGKQVVTYNHPGIDGQYEGTTHYMYDSKYDTENNTPDYVGTNYLFGISVEIRFFLPNKPGTLVTDEHYGNEDIYGDQMHFRFTGDDDVWVFVDDQMLLDLGGLHGRETGEINFATGTVTVNGVVHEEYSNLLKQYNKGEHILMFYYLERGSSLANCSIYFNLAPRYDFTIYKEDVLTGEPLNGSEFSVYEDLACTIPAELWTSYEAKLNGEPSTNVFTIKNGKASMWGFSSGNTYYIRETKPPDAPHYGMPHGIICLTFVKKDVYNYHAEIIPDSGGVSPGFMIHEFRVDNETQTAYIHATNGADWIKETTSITTRKRWADDKNHDDHLVTVYLTVTDLDGTVRRLQEERLYSENNWMVTWENLPKYWEDGLTPIQYGVEEAYSSGYYGIVEEHEGEFVVTYVEWVDMSTFEDGKEYVLRNPDGMALSTYQYADDTGYKWVTEREARNSDLALWTASVKNGTVRLTNRLGQTITYWYANGNPTDFYASATLGENNDRKQYFIFTQTGSGLVLRYSNRYLSPNLNSSNKFLPTSANAQSAALRLIPSTMVSVTTRVPVEGEGFMLTNSPLDKETSVTVRKDWVIPPDMDASIYEKEMVTIKLYANGKDTGRTVTLTLKNEWQDTFLGLPYEDPDGNVIVYTIEEVWKADRWSVSYGEMVPSGGTIPIYGTTVTNTYVTGGPPLPTTGSHARLLYTICGATLMLASLVAGIGLRRKRERRRE